jgi:membrane carboxypeptidase/penicillin-binding protein
LRSLIKIVRILFICVVLLAVAGGAFMGLTIWHFGRDLPNYQQLAHYSRRSPPGSTPAMAS